MEIIFLKGRRKQHNSSQTLLSSEDFKLYRTAGEDLARTVSWPSGFHGTHTARHYT